MPNSNCIRLGATLWIDDVYIYIYIYILGLQLHNGSIDDVYIYIYIYYKPKSISTYLLH
jgi:hypothetical protein